MTAAHAKLAPSAAARWVACPGSFRLAAMFPEAEGEAAREGTAAHWVAAEVLTGGTWPEVAPGGIIVTDEMREHIKTYVDDVLSARVQGAALEIERQIKAPSIHEDCWGTTDAVIYDGRRLIVWDFKYGHRYVDVFENWQLITYTAGILDFMGEQTPPNLEVVMRIVQPRSFHRDGPIREWRMDARGLGEYVRRLNAAAHEAMGNNPSTNVGPHCKYCHGRIGCRALQMAALDAVDQSGSILPLDVAPEGVGVELSLLKRASDALAARIASLEVAAMSSIKEGETVPGWLLESTIGREEWAKPVEEVIALGDLMGVKLARNPEPITPAQARKAGVPADVVAQYSRRKTGETKLVPIDTTKARRAFGGENTNG